MNYPQRSRRGQDNLKGTTSRDVNAAQRVALALKLKAQGFTYEEIAAQAGYSSKGSVHKAVMRELQRNISPNVEQMRAHEALILEQLHRRCMKAAMDEGNKDFLFAVDRVIAIRERWSKLFGLDVPVENAIAANMVVIREMPQGYLGLEPPAS